MPEYNARCAIWPEFDAYKDPVHFQDRSTGDFIYIYESPRSGGRYRIDSNAQHELQQPDTTDELRKKVSWWLASQRRQDVEIPLVTRHVLSPLQEQPMLHPSERAEWLLWYLADRTSRIGQPFWLSIPDERLRPGMPQEAPLHPNDPIYQSTPFYHGVLAATQSESMEEIRELAHHLIEKQALRDVSIRTVRGDMRVRVAVAGFEELRQRTQAPAYDQAFVAMWLAQSIRHIYDKGIKPAIEDAGYRPYLIIRDPSVNKIDDAIIANIRQSKFMVADLTHGDDGHRGSVYYEAGYAEGLGLQVIRTCRSDLIDANSLAFDTRQHNHIGWDKNNTDYPTFIQELTNRIIARVGPGPIQNNA